MKVLIDIPDNKQGQSFLRSAKELLPYVLTATKITATEAEILAELAEINKAHKLADKVNSGKLKTRSATDLLNEL